MTSILFSIGAILMESIQMKLSKKQKTFSKCFTAFLKFRLCFERFEKKDDPHRLYILEILDCKRRG